MKKLVITAALLGLVSFAGAQQVKLLEDIPAEQGNQAGDAPQVIPPSETKPAPAAPPQAPAAAVKPPAAPTLKQSPIKQALTAKPAAAPAAAVKPVEAAKTEAVKPAAPAAAKPAEVKPAAPAAAAPAAPAAPKPAVVKPAAPAAAKPEAPKPAAPAAADKAGFSVGKTHIVTGGDTLWDLSGKYYKDPYKWGKIYNANLGTVENPDRIYPKEELVIPDITEEVKPEVKKPFVIGESETVKEAEMSGSEVPQAEAAAAPAAAAPAAAAPDMSAKAQMDRLTDSYDTTDLSEEMPEHQKEWASGVKIVPDSWKEDGVITAKEKGDDESMEDSLSSGGEIMTLSMDSAGLVKPGDQLYVYLKGSEAYDKAGNRLGREVQPAGVLQVLETDGSGARARVIDAVTAIAKGYVVKKK